MIEKNLSLCASGSLYAITYYSVAVYVNKNTLLLRSNIDKLIDKDSIMCENKVKVFVMGTNLLVFNSFKVDFKIKLDNIILFFYLIVVVTIYFLFYEEVLWRVK